MKNTKLTQAESKRSLHQIFLSVLAPYLLTDGDISIQSGGLHAPQEFKNSVGIARKQGIKMSSDYQTIVGWGKDIGWPIAGSLRQAVQDTTNVWTTYSPLSITFHGDLETFLHKVNTSSSLKVAFAENLPEEEVEPYKMALRKLGL